MYSIRADKVCTRKRQDKHRLTPPEKLAKKLIDSLGKIEQESRRNNGEPRSQPSQHEHRATGQQHQHHRGPRDQHVPRHLYKHQNPLQ